VLDDAALLAASGRTVVEEVVEDVHTSDVVDVENVEDVTTGLNVDVEIVNKVSVVVTSAGVVTPVLSEAGAVVSRAVVSTVVVEKVDVVKLAEVEVVELRRNGLSTSVVVICMALWLSS
jgi:Ni2+-binding GTPase involved in maturation of urease and hydrogenase